MNVPPDNPVFEPLKRLNQRVRWKRWLRTSHRFAWLIGLAFLTIFLADTAIGLRTLTLRICFAGLALAAGVLFLFNGWSAWFTRLNPLGLAQLLERRYPSLAERLLTVVQLDTDPSTSANAEFTATLRSDTARELATIEPTAACPLDRERRAWTWTAAVWSIALVGLVCLPSFREFSGRFFASLATPLTPYRIEFTQGSGYALRGGSYQIEGTIDRVDPYAPNLSECSLVRADESQGALATAALQDGRFAFSLTNLREGMRCRVLAGDIASEPVEITLVDPPVLSAMPTVRITPPPYVTTAPPGTHDLTPNGTLAEVLQYSRLAFALTFDQPIAGTLIVETTTDENVTTQTLVPLKAGAEANQCIAKALAGQAGKVRAEVKLELAHGLLMTMPLGSWSVHADRLPRFTQALRFHGGAGSLQSAQQYRIAPDDVVRLETTVADDEGLSAVDVEFRVNDEPARVVKWFDAAGKKEFAINERMPLPRGLKQGDRVQFRVRAHDNRALRRGEIDAKAVLPAADLLPQSTVAPEASGGPEAWIQLYVDPSIDSFLKQQADAQGAEVRGVIDSIQVKIRNEALQVEKMKRSIHLQAALTLDQRLQTEKLQTLNREIVEDLLRAAQRFSLNPELARLSEHFLDIAEVEMASAGAALARFSEKDRPLSAGEKELQTAHAALLQALKKLDRMQDWNKLLAQARLDQAQLDKLAQRQQDLADQLEKLRANEPMNEADLAKQIEKIRQEQAKVAEDTEQLKDKNKLVQESLAALERQRVEKLAAEAQKLAAEQQAQQAMPAEQMPMELKDRLQELTRRQAELAERTQAKTARAAADALKKPNLEQAIDRQKAQERELKDAVGKLLPGVVTNALREQILQLAKQQKDIYTDLERTGAQVAQLKESMLKERLKNLVQRQRDLQADIVRLPTDAKLSAARSAQQAAELLAVRDALNSFFAMEKTEQELTALARSLPQTLVKDRNDIIDPVVLAKLKQVEESADQQQKLRKDTEQLLAEWRKATAKKDGNPLREKTEQLTKELLELAQKGNSPEAKAMAKQTAAALNQAKKAMDASNDAKGKGESAKMQDAEAAKQLELAFKQLQKFAQNQAMKQKDQDNPEKTASALKEGAAQMKIAQAALPKISKDAQSAMQAAAAKLAQAANQASQQTSRSLPKSARNSLANKSPAPGSSKTPLPSDLKLDALQGRAWGELPGELRTRLIQDYRTRYGDEYAEVIRQYFERLADRKEK